MNVRTALPHTSPPIGMTEAQLRGDLARTVPAYWFGGIDEQVRVDENQPDFHRWNAKDPQVDEEIRRRFGVLHGVLRDWSRRGWQPRGPTQQLGTILVLDQFSRHIHRGAADAFDCDDLARAVTIAALDGADHRNWPMFHRLFLYMPLMHSEALADQRRMVVLYEHLCADSRTRSPVNVPFFEMTLRFARRHAEIVSRFGRFPHRNDALGRHSTAEEIAFLQTPHSSF